MYRNDKRTVMTLDAGGTNFVFSAIRANEEVVEPVRLQAVPDDIDACLETLRAGFAEVKARLKEPPVAISFAFPGPADYQNGVIGDLPNFPAFRGGVALGPYLEEAFGMPVYINNDGNLFAYGEALAGMLPEVNAMLCAAGNTKRYRNLLGITLGTGFGAGVVVDRCLLTGDNGCGGDVWLMRNAKHPEMIAEEGVSIRAVRRVYAELSGCSDEGLTPKDIYDIAEGTRPGDVRAAQKSFDCLGETAGAAIVSALDIADGLVAIGGGLAGAAKYIMPGLMREMRRTLSTFAGGTFPCLQAEAYCLDDDAQRQSFLTSTSTRVPVPHSTRTVPYDSAKRIGVAVSKLGASRAIALGAYAYALQQADNAARQ